MTIDASISGNPVIGVPIYTTLDTGASRHVFLVLVIYVEIGLVEKSRLVEFRTGRNQLRNTLFQNLSTAGLVDNITGRQKNWSTAELVDSRIGQQ